MAKRWKNLKKHKMKLTGFEEKCFFCKYLKFGMKEYGYNKCIKLNIINYDIKKHKFCKKFLCFI